MNVFNHQLLIIQLRKQLFQELGLRLQPKVIFQPLYPALKLNQQPTVTLRQLDKLPFHQ